MEGIFLHNLFNQEPSLLKFLGGTVWDFALPYLLSCFLGFESSKVEYLNFNLHLMYPKNLAVSVYWLENGGNRNTVPYHSYPTEGGELWGYSIAVSPPPMAASSSTPLGIYSILLRKANSTSTSVYFFLGNYLFDGHILVIMSQNLLQTTMKKQLYVF